MYVTFLVLMTWPLVVAIVGTVSLHRRLRSPIAFFLSTLFVCVAAELGLSYGSLPIVVGFDVVGMVFKMLVGIGVLFLFYRLDQRRNANIEADGCDASAIDRQRPRG